MKKPLTLARPLKLRSLKPQTARDCLAFLQMLQAERHLAFERLDVIDFGKTQQWPAYELNYRAGRVMEVLSRVLPERPEEDHCCAWPLPNCQVLCFDPGFGTVAQQVCQAAIESLQSYLLNLEKPVYWSADKSRQLTVAGQRRRQTDIYLQEQTAYAITGYNTSYGKTHDVSSNWFLLQIH